MERDRAPGEREHEERRQPAAAAPAPLPPAAATVLGLQQGAGNAAVSRLLARWPMPLLPPILFPGHTPDALDRERARAQRDAFVRSGVRGPTTYDPSTRNPDNYYGGFDVSYDPGRQLMQALVKGAIAFLPGMALVGGRAVAKESSPEAATAADEINKLPRADRAAEVARWRWSKDGGPDSGDEQALVTAFRDNVVATWSGKHQFRSTRPHWDDVGAEVAVDVQITEGAQGATDHMKVNAYKVPSSMNITNANVNRTAKSKGAFGNTLTMNSASVLPKDFNKLVHDIAFEPGTATLTADARTRLGALGKVLPDAPAGATIAADEVTARVAGADDAARQARFAAVRDALTAAGVSAGRVRLGDGGSGDTGQVVVGDGQVQTTVAHEMGHMFGLDDEYPTDGKYAAGNPTEHTGFAAKAGFTGAQHARSDSIMSSGTNVKAHHYVTFLDALKVVTGMDEWEVGAARQVGDFPLGGPGGTAPTTPPDTAYA